MSESQVRQDVAKAGAHPCAVDLQPATSVGKDGRERPARRTVVAPQGVRQQRIDAFLRLWAGLNDAEKAAVVAIMGRKE